jgi:hypothetical protein
MRNAPDQQNSKYGGDAAAFPTRAPLLTQSQALTSLGLVISAELLVIMRYVASKVEGEKDGTISYLFNMQNQSFLVTNPLLAYIVPVPFL